LAKQAVEFAERRCFARGVAPHEPGDATRTSRTSTLRVTAVCCSEGERLCGRAALAGLLNMNILAVLPQSQKLAGRDLCPPRGRLRRCVLNGAGSARYSGSGFHGESLSPGLPIAIGEPVAKRSAAARREEPLWKGRCRHSPIHTFGGGSGDAHGSLVGLGAAKTSKTPRNLGGWLGKRAEAVDSFAAPD